MRHSLDRGILLNYLFQFPLFYYGVQSMKLDLTRQGPHLCCVLFVPIVGASVDVARDALVTAIDLVRNVTVSFTEIRKKIGSMIGGEPLAVDAVFIPAIEGDAKSLLVGTFRTSRFLNGEMSNLGDRKGLN